MSLFKHAMVSGINDALMDRGVVAWPNEKVAFEVCSKVAEDLDGPDMLPEGGLAKESALLIGNRLKAASDNLISQGYTPDAMTVLRTKQASQMDFADRAAIVAEACMTKAAEEASLTNVGENTPESAAKDDQHAKLDQKNRATNKYLTGVGKTRFPSGGVVGQQMIAPERQSGPAISNSMTALDKQAATELGELIAAMDEGAEKNAAIKIALGGGAEQRTLLENLRELLTRAKGGVQSGAHSFVERAKANPFAAMRSTHQHPVMGATPDMDTSVLDPLKSRLMATGKNLAMDPKTYAALALAGGGAAGAKHLMGGAPEESAEMPEEPKVAMAFLGELNDRGYGPTSESIVAAAGLAEAGDSGREVMAHVLDTVKTAGEADEIIAQILHHQGEAGQLASPELVQAIEHLLSQHEAEGEGGMPPQAGGAPPQGGEGGPEDMAAAEAPKTAGRVDNLRGFIGQHAAKAQGAAHAMGRAVTGGGQGRTKAVEHLKKHKGHAAGVLGAGAATIGGVGAGAKKLFGKKDEGKEATASDLLSQLKAAADGGSLTGVGPNTPESAAHDDQFAELDQKNRSTAEYLLGVGKTKMPIKGQIFDVEKAPKHDAVPTSNTPTNETKNAEEAEYVERFRKVASAYGQYLPSTMPREEKIAHLQTLLSVPPADRDRYLLSLRQS